MMASLPARNIHRLFRKSEFGRQLPAYDYRPSTYRINSRAPFSRATLERHIVFD